MPTWDVGAHQLDMGCPCEPYEDVYAVNIMHNSFDGREKYEQGGKRN